MKGITIKRIANEVNVEKNGINGYIIAEEGREYGLFFRSPVQQIKASYEYDLYPSGQDAFELLKKYDTSRLYRLYQNLLGNASAIKKFRHEADDMAITGRKVNVLASPIYFVRPYCRTKATGSGSCAFKKVISYGFEGYKNDVSGACDVEKTHVVFKDGTRTTILKRGSYHYTYTHIIKDELTA